MEDSKLFLKGKIVNVLAVESGQGAAKPWKKQSYILQTTSFDKKVCFTLWGEKIDEYKIQEGANVTVHINIESREYNGKWYTDIRAWKVEQDGERKTSSEQEPPEKPDNAPFVEDIGDLPF